MPCIFGEVPITTQQLFDELKARVLEDFTLNKTTDTNTAWTSAIKKAMSEVVSTQGCNAIYSRSDPKCSEFMLDFVSWESRNGIERALIGAESEWGNPWHFKSAKNYQYIIDSIETDFWKLLSFKAPLKVLVYTTANPAMRETLHKRLKEVIQSFTQHVAGETYAFYEFISLTEAYAFEYVVPNDGGVAHPEFRKLNQH
jgi:hypothetical protein